jgi:hypothetical protein
MPEIAPLARSDDALPKDVAAPDEEASECENKKSG